MIENVSVVFTDLVGSTQLAARLGPDAADDLRKQHFAVLRDAIAAAGGTEVKNLGDGLMVVFATASAAVSCAVAMQQRVDRDNRTSDHHLELRIGLSGGEAVREGDDYFGDPVVEAARLCGRADSGQVLAALVVKATAGRRAGHPFRPVGALTLKGLPEPLETLEVVWEPLSDAAASPTSIPLPLRLATAPGSGVIGRQMQLDELDSARKQSAAGHGPEVVLIGGEPGVGKTTLAADTARRAFDGGGCALLGSCDEDGGAPYQPWAEALGHYVAHAPVAMLEAHVRAHGGELARLVPALRRRVPSLGELRGVDADSERFMLFGAVVALLTDACAVAPVVMVLDDIQWADQPSLRLLRHVVSSGEPTRLLVVGTHRDLHGSGSLPLGETIAALRREREVRRIKLNGLDDRDVLRFMEAAAGHDLDAEGRLLAHAVHRETAGNPFYVTEILRHLSETGAIYQSETGRWVPGVDLVELGLPDSVREVVIARVNRLGDEARQTLSIAAVIGRAFDLELLARATERPETQLLDILDAAVDVALVHEVAEQTSHYRFSHALVQHTLYQELGATRRTRAHRTIAEALEDIVGDQPGDRVGELARHWLKANHSVDVARALHYVHQAANAALEALAPDDAVESFALALELAEQLREPDPLLVVELLIGLGTAQRLAALPAFRDTLLDAARRAEQLGASDLLVQAALANNRGTVSVLGSSDEEKLQVLRAAQRVVPEADSVERALLLATECSEMSFGSPLEQRRSIAEAAVAMAHRLDDPVTTLRVLNLVETALRLPASLPERLLYATEALALAETFEDPPALFWSLLRRRTTALQAADFETARSCLDRARPVCDRLRQPVLRWFLTMHDASDALLVGDPDRAEGLAVSAFAVAEASSQPDGFVYFGGQLGAVRHQQGRLPEIQASLAEVAEAKPDLPAYTAALAIAHLQNDDRDEASRMLHRAARDGFDSVPLNALWTDCIVTYAEVAVELDAVDEVSQLFALLAPYTDQMAYDGIVPLDPIAFYAGSLLTVAGDFETASRHLVTAAEINARAGATFAQARTDRAFGRLCARRDGPRDQERARAYLEGAQRVAADRRYVALERAANADLALLG